MNKLKFLAAAGILVCMLFAYTAHAQPVQKVNYLTKTEYQAKVHNYEVDRDSIKFCGNKPAIVCFDTEDNACIYCRDMDIPFAILANLYKGKIDFYKMQDNDVLAVYGIKNIPNFLFFTDNETGGLEGSASYADFIQIIETAFAIKLPEEKTAELKKMTLNASGYNSEGVELYNAGKIAEAVDYFRKSADMGNRQGLYNLAACYRNGNGVEKNNTKAMELYRQAADLDYVAAQNMLGLMYENAGQAQEAFKWYTKAAEQNNVSAQYNLGSLYMNGIGVTKDLATAKRWFEMAAEQGDEDAKERLKELTNKGYDKVWDYDDNGLAKVFIGKITEKKAEYKEGQGLAAQALAAMGHIDYKYHGKYGLIDKNGKEILPVEYDDIDNGFDKHHMPTYYPPEGDGYLGYYLVSKNKKCGLVDKTGKQITDFIFDNIDGFYNGYAMARVEKDIEYFIDKTGKRVGSVYERINLWKFRRYYKVIKNGKFGVIDLKLGTVLPCEYDDLQLYHTTNMDGIKIVADAAFIKKGGSCYRIFLKSKERTKFDCKYWD